MSLLPPGAKGTTIRMDLGALLGAKEPPLSCEKALRCPMNINARQKRTTAFTTFFKFKYIKNSLQSMRPETFLHSIQA
jgi:hypothetical protein